MQTKQLYYEDPYLKECTAKVIKVFNDFNNKYRIILDQTIFYPMGGGQPTDQGTISFTNVQTTENIKAKVVQVQMNQGEIYHFIESKVPIQEGLDVICQIDWDRRYKNMKVHSAAHIIDFALIKMGIVPNILQPLKGDHGKKAYIIYAGKFDESLKPDLMNTIDQIIQNNLKFTTKFVNFDELQTKSVYLQPGLPTNKPLRMLTLEGIGSVADGGMQVNETKEVGKIEILDIIIGTDESEIRYSIA